jgi:flavin-dependent dehydrogenase
MKIAIIRAGPAGCHPAYLLGDTEHELLLFDHRVGMPHEAGYEKPCGGGLSPIVGQRFPDVRALPFPRHRPARVILRASDGSQVVHELASPDWAIVSRAEFGWALPERALCSGRVRFVRQRVRDVERNGEGWLLCTGACATFSTDFLVGADGVRSLVRREVVAPIPRQHLALAVGYRIRGVPDAILFQTYADLEGHLWSFPRADHASVGIAARLDRVAPQDLWQRVDQFLAETCPEAEVVKHWAGLLPMAQDPSLWDTPGAGPGWALLGDAAGHMHSPTGEGISYALWSAELLAKAFGQADPQVYEKLWRQEYGRGLMATSARVSRLVQADRGYEMVFHWAMATALSSTRQQR